MIRRKLMVVIATCLGALALASPACAQVSIESFSTTSSDSQAGGHPDLITTFTLAEPGIHEAARNVTFEAPQGVFGNPNVLTPCTSSDFALTQCPVNSQAGLITVRANYLGNPNFLLGTAPLFDMVPQSEETARYSFIVPTLNIPIAIPVSVRTAGDYGLRFTVSEISQLTPLAFARLTFWGMPAKESHDSERFAKGSPGEPAGCPALEDASCIETGSHDSISVKPMIDYPTTCNGESLLTELRATSYQDPSPSQASIAHSEYPPVTGCEHEVFNPVMAASLTTENTDSASGLNLGFTIPQTLGNTPSPSQAKSVTVELPPGLTINPDAADGQSACSDAQANFSSEALAACPDNAKIGTVSIATPALDGPLVGSLYIGEPKPGDQYRIFMVVDGFGIHAKLIGSFQPDPQTGALTALFEDLPQVPFEKFDIHLFASDRGLLASPIACRLYPVRAEFSPWNATLANQTSEQLFALRSGPLGAECSGEKRPFDPRLVAGTSNPLAGAFSDFFLRLERNDGDQFLRDLNFRMPPGFTGDLRGISYCPEASIATAAANQGRSEQASPSCPSSSLIGTTNVAAGPGSHPFHAVGKMYMAGPFKGAPLSLVTVTPALAGPYDYGVVVVRVALHVDPETAQVSAVSDTVPSIIGGIPIRMRAIQVNINRTDVSGSPNFTINPTNCRPFTVDSQGIGDQGTVTDFSSYFHAVNCRSLPFKPTMAVRQLGGRKGTRRAANPSLQFDLTTRPGDANIKSMAVTLPSAFEIDSFHLGNLCTEKLLVETRCAGKQAIGMATTSTPLLDQPLSGAVYAVSGSGGLPRLAFLLDGQVSLLPRAESRQTPRGLRTTVPVVPDAPIGHFHLVVFGGKHGYLANTRSLCSHSPVTTVDYTAQNGKTVTQKAPIKAACGVKQQRPKRHRH
jgi:hypothetical protein